MRVSLNTIKQYTSVDVSVDELVAKINGQLGGVEEVVDLGKRYKDALIVKIVSAEQHPNADRLQVCKIDDGGVRQDVGRDENGHVQVVCGAPNAREGIFVVWLPPKSTVPASFDEKELFVLEARELRGVVSNGMLASAKELGVGEAHDGILEIDPTEWKPNDTEIKPGASFAKVYGLDDTIIDIENKMFTHRPDCFGQLGVAREIAGIQHKQFISPDWYMNVPTFGDGEGLQLEVFNEAGEKVPRFMAVTMKNVIVKPSPLWLQVELVRLGGKPINNVVDVTNYVMLLTAQPTHAYDYDKLRGGILGARQARAGEMLKLLNGKTYEFDGLDIVIVDGEGPVGLAGIMGGGKCEVSSETKNIVLEVANFDMYAVRKSSMRHGLFTDALTRFNKGQSPLQNPHVLSLLMQSIHDVAGGEQASVVVDNTTINHQANTTVVAPDFINARLGLNLSSEEIQQLLENVEFTVEQGSELKITAPFWRTDIALREDIVEEVGRLYGFDKLPRELPKRSTKPAPTNQTRVLEQKMRETLARAGANEVLTYSFVHEKIIANAGQDVFQAYKLSNALSPDLQYYRLSITPSLLDKIHGNVRAGYDNFALFEIGKGHSKNAELDVGGLPVELRRLGLVMVGKKDLGAPYYQAKRLLEYLASKLGLKLAYKPLPEESNLIFSKPFEPRRSARVIDVKSGQALGVVGEYKQSVRKNFKLPELTSGFELLPEAIELALQHVGNNYQPLSRYPGTERDICFQVESDVTYQQIIEIVAGVLDETELETTILPVDIYQPENGTTKNMTLRIKLASREKTLTSSEVSELVSLIEQAATKTVHATIV